VLAGRDPLDAMIDRPPRERILAMGAAWVAFMAGLVVEGDVHDATSSVAAGAIGAVFVFVGFAAASRCRALSRRVIARPLQLVLLSLAAGTILGVANLAANWAIAQVHPAIRMVLVERMKTLPPLIAIVGAPLVEEVSLRLFLMSAIAWVVLRVTKHTTLAFAVALIGSSLFFALLHLARPVPIDPAVANYYRLSLLVKYTLAGLPLGWIFWRWGLPYSILCHMAANAAHLVLQRCCF
jgi:membrane protease YdiL (CAAX protease family)